MCAAGRTKKGAVKKSAFSQRLFKSCIEIHQNLLKKDNNNKIIYINENQDNVQINISKSSLKMYISNKKNQNAFNTLKEVLESEKYWEEENTTKN